MITVIQKVDRWGFVKTEVTVREEGFPLEYLYPSNNIEMGNFWYNRSENEEWDFNPDHQDPIPAREIAIRAAFLVENVKAAYQEFLKRYTANISV